VIAALRNVQIDPNPKGLPGSDVLQGFIDGSAFWALLACLGGIVVGAAVWAWAAHSNIHHYSANGRRGLLVSAAGALIVGAAAAIINFFTDAGSRVH
jgi:hypothetical protein